MTSLQPFIDEKFDGQIWKFVIDDSTGSLFAEIRSADKKEVSFASINLNTAKLNFKGLVQPEQWLTGLEACFNGVLFLNGYQSAQSPVHKGITAIDGNNATVLWSNYNYAIHQLSINGPVAYNTQIQPPAFYLLDAQSGATLRLYNAAIDADIVRPGIALPDILSALPLKFNIFFDGELVGNYHYMAYNDFRIVSLHASKHGFLKQYLFIALNGDIVYEDILADNIQKLQPEAFMMYKKQLIYIKNTAELKIVNL